MPKAAAQKIRWIANWLTQWQAQSGLPLPGDESAWQWAYTAFHTFPVVGWGPGLAYKHNQRYTDSNGHCQIVTSPGTSGPEMPVWNQAGGMTTDGGAQWIDMGIAAPW